MLQDEFAAGGEQKEPEDAGDEPNTKVRYNLTVFDLKKNFIYSSWKRDEWQK